jgi:hypothetical protein
LGIAQSLIDSKVGIVLSTALHTLGAIGLLGGLIGYVAWHRHLMRGHHHANVLHFATFLTYISILVNLLGGFMRTYETGHPHITDFATSSWVRAIAIKHVFLFLGMGAAVYLFERVAPRHLKAMWDSKLPETSLTGHTLGVLLVALGIVVAAVLGAVSSVLPVGAAAMEEPDLIIPDSYLNVSGTYQATPLTPGTTESDLPVPAGMADIELVLTWTVSQSNLGVQLVDPGGTIVKDLQGSGGRVEGSLGRAPVAGTWTYRIVSPDGIVDTAWTLAIHMPAGNGTHQDH